MSFAKKEAQRILDAVPLDWASINNIIPVSRNVNDCLDIKSSAITIGSYVVKMSFRSIDPKTGFFRDHTSGYLPIALNKSGNRSERTCKRIAVEMAKIAMVKFESLHDGDYSKPFVSDADVCTFLMAEKILLDSDYDDTGEVAMCRCVRTVYTQSSKIKTIYRQKQREPGSVEDSWLRGREEVGFKSKTVTSGSKEFYFVTVQTPISVSQSSECVQRGFSCYVPIGSNLRKKKKAFRKTIRAIEKSGLKPIRVLKAEVSVGSVKVNDASAIWESKTLSDVEQSDPFENFNFYRRKHTIVGW